MPKLNVYTDHELLKRIRKLNLPLSEICQEALWEAVENAERSSCQCGDPACFLIRNEISVYSCAQHVVLYLDRNSTVRPL